MCLRPNNLNERQIWVEYSHSQGQITRYPKSQVKKKKPESQSEITALGPRATPLHHTVLNATVMMVSEQGLTKPQIIFFYAALLCLEQTEHTEIYS